MLHEHPPAAEHSAGDHSGHGGAGMEHAGHEHTKGVHGMLVAGDEPVYLSHLPMFDHATHDAQVILEVAFSGPGDPHETYTRDRAQSGARFYTFAPHADPPGTPESDKQVEFVLADLVQPSPQQPRLRAFTGDLFRGHFERQGVPIASDVRVTVSNVVFFRQFDPAAEPLGQLTYVLFGKGSDCFLAHLITRPPDFDQIVSVRIAGPGPTDAELRQGVRVSIAGKANTIEQRLSAGERVSGERQHAGEPAPAPTTIQLDVVAEIYLEEGELRSPPDFDPTAAERAAGFV
jgi:hypothetical protein